MLLFYVSKYLRANFIALGQGFFDCVGVAMHPHGEQYFLKHSYKIQINKSHP